MSRIASIAAYARSMNFEEVSPEVIGRERQLLDPEVRRQPELVRALLHPEFIEFGASGRIWDLNSIVETLASEQSGNEIKSSDFVATPLGESVLLLTFRTESAERMCLRSSVWVRSEDGKWLLRFHQGTVVPQ